MQCWETPEAPGDPHVMAGKVGEGATDHDKGQLVILLCSGETGAERIPRRGIRRAYFV